METELSEGEAVCMLSSIRSRDLLHRFSGQFSSDEAADPDGADSDEIELGLSLGGSLSSANSYKHKILRSSSIPANLPHEVPPSLPLFRTSSLPEEEMCMRKEMQSRRRMEVKRKREERRSFIMSGERSEEDLEEASVVKLRKSRVENEGFLIPGGDKESGVFSPAISRWTAGAGLPPALLKGGVSASQGSAVSQGSNSSGGSESESRPGQGFEPCGFIHASETRNPPSFPTVSEHKNHKSSSFSPFSNPFLDVTSGNEAAISRKRNDSSELRKSLMEEMPAVSTKGGGGPNGRRIEGFLYKYGREEEVKIVCVCHGSFHTPAEFVRHAGGSNVLNPLRHIVVNPNPNTFLR